MTRQEWAQIAARLALTYPNSHFDDANAAAYYEDLAPYAAAAVTKALRAVRAARPQFVPSVGELLFELGDPPTAHRLPPAPVEADTPGEPWMLHRTFAARQPATWACDCDGVLRWHEAGFPQFVRVECEVCGENFTAARALVTNLTGNRTDPDMAG